MVNFKSSLLVLCLCAAFVPGAALAGDDNVPSGMKAGAMPPPARGAENNHGHFVCTAAINAGGGVFSGEYVNAAQTSNLSPGTYQVAFKAPCSDVRIAGGWFRIAQPDTLTWGTMPTRTCTIADRANNVSAIWVQCFDGTGRLTNTSFTLHVSR
jgi:hypothetical protein